MYDKPYTIQQKITQLILFQSIFSHSNHFFQCREIGFEIHEEILKVLHELHTAMKTNHTYQSEFRQAESKLAVRQ